MTWRESVFGFLPTESVYMKLTRDRVSGSASGMGGVGAGEALGENLGSVKWRVSEDILDHQSCWKLHSESGDAKTLNLRTEDLWISMRTNLIVRQDEAQIGLGVDAQSQAVYYDDRIEDRWTGPDHKTKTLTMVPEGGMAAVQRRFAPLVENGKPLGTKEFLMVDSLTGTFHKIFVEPAGRFRGSVAGDSYDGNSYRFTCEGKSQVAMLTAQGELVKVDFGQGMALNLTSATRSRRHVPQPTHSHGT